MKFLRDPEFPEPIKFIDMDARAAELAQQVAIEKALAFVAFITVVVMLLSAWRHRAKLMAAAPYIIAAAIFVGCGVVLVAVFPGSAKTLLYLGGIVAIVTAPPVAAYFAFKALRFFTRT